MIWVEWKTSCNDRLEKSTKCCVHCHRFQLWNGYDKGQMITSEVFLNTGCKGGGASNGMWLCAGSSKSEKIQRVAEEEDNIHYQCCLMSFAATTFSQQNLSLVSSYFNFFSPVEWASLWMCLSSSLHYLELDQWQGLSHLDQGTSNHTGTQVLSVTLKRPLLSGL